MVKRADIHYLTLVTILCLSFTHLYAQRLVPFRLQDTGETTSYTATAGEDAEVIINPPSFTDNGDGTITDNNTGLVWQKTDGGEMTFENSAVYCIGLVLGGYSDWRLPTGKELFSINSYNCVNPAMNTVYFPKTDAEYWWTGEVAADDPAKVWVVNAGGGIGAHPKSETVSAGGTRRFHVRAVRDPVSTVFNVSHFTDNGNGTITDNFSGLVWQQYKAETTMTWEEALTYAGISVTAGKTDWRLPNIKELQSLNDPALYKPSFDQDFFPGCVSGNFWSSTTQQNATERAWDINIDYGIVSYNNKTQKENVLLVRGGYDNPDLNFNEVIIPGGEFEMGDHYGFVDPQHPSDELPLHMVKVDSLYLSQTETTNLQFLAFLNMSLLKGEVEVRNKRVFRVADTNTLCLTRQLAPYYSISYDGSVFSIADFRLNHPMVGVMWFGAVAFCNWLSENNGLEPCYNTAGWSCDFTKNGYRLPTEAEWEYAGRGGHNDPYFNYPWGNDQDKRKANWPGSQDPYEGTSESAYPFTTPAGFYDGSLRLKTDFNWPGNASSYQTHNGSNSYNLFDMAGNVWELLNDWYSQNYYSVSPYDNPQGPATGFIMPDGKPYRGMRGGNWYNGYTLDTVNDGHSRVSNRNPSYYRGPQDPNHPWYHVGFRVARKYEANITGTTESELFPDILEQNCPNPFSNRTTIRFNLLSPGHTRVRITNPLGQVTGIVLDASLEAGPHNFEWDASGHPAGIYYYTLETQNARYTKKMILIK